MFSFKTLFVAGLAAVASVSAAPCAERRHDQPEVDTAAVTSVIDSTSTISTTISLTSTASAVVASATNAVPATGAEQPSSVTDILNDVMAQIKPLTDTMSEQYSDSPLFIQTNLCSFQDGLTKETATVEKVTEITNELKSILNIAIKEVNAIVTSPLDSILGLLDIGGLGQLIATLLNVSAFSLVDFMVHVAHGRSLGRLRCSRPRPFCRYQPRSHQASFASCWVCV